MPNAMPLILGAAALFFLTRREGGAPPDVTDWERVDDGSHKVSETLEYRWTVQRKISTGEFGWGVDRAVRLNPSVDWGEWERISDGLADTELGARGKALAAATADAYGFA
jgi:hypothetical protein